MPTGVSYLVCGYSNTCQARKTLERKTKMKDPQTLEDLLNNPEDMFHALMDAYPANNGETDKQTR